MMPKSYLLPLALTLLTSISLPLTVAWAAPALQAPTNDDFADALAASPLPYTDTQDTTSATEQMNDPAFPCISSSATTNWGRGWHSVWYAYTATVDGVLHVDTVGSDYDTVLGVWTGTWGSLTNEGCSDDISWPGNPQSALDVPVVSGTTYYIEAVGYRSSSAGNLVLSADLVLPPANDDFDNAFLISPTPYSYAQSTLLATTAIDDPLLACGSGDQASHSVWYRFTAPGDGTLHVDTGGSDYDTMLAVWTGVWGALSSVACDDDVNWPSDPTSSVDLPVSGGVTYHVEVVSYGSSPGGALTLQADFAATKPLYMHRLGASVTIVDGTNTTEIMDRRPVWGGEATVTFDNSPTYFSYLYPGLTGDLVLQGNVNVPLYLEADNAQNADVTVGLADRAPDGSTTVIDTTTVNVPAGSDGWYLFTLSGVNYTVAQGHALIVGMRTAAPPQDVTLHFDAAAYDSRVELLVTTYVAIEEVSALSACHPTGATTFSQGQALTLTARVSDPFGSYDISGADLAAVDPGGGEMLPGQSMTPLVTTSGAITYTYAHTLSPTATLGIYTAVVTGTEANGVQATGSTTFAVSSPPVLTASLFATPTVVSTGRMITVTMVVTNGGQAMAVGVTPSALVTSGVGSVALVAGPVPVSADVPGGGTRTFTWIYTGTQVGWLNWTGDATGTDVNSCALVSAPAAISNDVLVDPGFAMEWGTVSVGNGWTTVNLGNSYNDMVVVATPQYANNAIPIVTRVRDAAGSSFEVRLQSPSAGTPVAETVHYLVMDTGAYTLPNGIHIEAQKFNSTLTDGRNSSWTGQVQSYLQGYTNPVVVGQVMSYNDPDWSVFWDRGSSAANPPDAANLWAGKMVSKDPSTVRADETVGFIVFEEGHGTVFGVEYEARLGEDIVNGVVDAPPYNYNFSQPFASPPQVGVLSKAAEDGGDGAWAVLYGASSLGVSSMDLALDEDAIGGASRAHPADEQVAYLVFERPLVVHPAPFLELSKRVSPVGGFSLILPGDTVIYAVDYANMGMLPASNVVVTDRLPVDVTFGSTSPGCVHDGSPIDGVVTCNLGNVGAFEANTVYITVAVGTSLPANAVLTNTASIDSAEGVTATTILTTPVTSFNLVKMETFTTTVDSNWSTINLSNVYNDMVVVCTPQYANNTRPLVTRVRSADKSSFQVRLQNPGDAFAPVAETVHCLVLETGRFTLPDGRKIEAQKYNSTRTDSNSSWVGEVQSYLNSYTNPVVVGQVMSENDPDWSVFWQRGSSTGNPPNAASLWTGKTVAEDADTTRVDETVGFVVVEQGHGSMGTAGYEAWLGGDWVNGVGNAPPYVYNFNQPFASPPRIALASQAGMDGNNGGWAVLYGTNPLRATSIDLVIDEDQIGDNERSHTNEQVAYLVFEEALVLRPTHDLHVAKADDPDPATVGEPLAYTIVYTNSGVLTTTNVVVTESYDANVTFDSASVAPAVGDNVWHLGDLGPGASASLVVTVTASVGLPDLATVTNTVAIGSDQTNPVTATESTLVRAYVLEMSKWDAPDPVMVGGLLTYTLVYTNAGARDLTSLVLTETYDAGVSFLSASVSPTLGNNVWHLGDLTAGEVRSLVITASVIGGSTLVNRAEIGADQGVTATATATTSVISLLKMEVFTTTADHTWTTVPLSNTYNSMVVVCTPQYANNTLPLVTRVRNAAGASFQVRLQNPHDSDPNLALNAETVHCLVTEEGPAILPGGRRIEARKYSSTVTDHDNAWVGEVQSYLHTYVDPVVLGQVMSYNDLDWSVFWARGSSQTEPPDAANLFTGKTVAEDWDIDRIDETIGLLVVERGHDTIFDVEYEAWLGPDTIWGVDNVPPFSYSFGQPFPSPPQVALAAQGGMDGGNGGWALLYGASPLSATAIDLAVDEDQIGDGDRWHTSEQVSYLAFEEPLVLRPSNDLAIFKADDADPVAVGSTLVYTISYVNSGVVPATGIVVTETYDTNVSFVSASVGPTVGNNVWHIGNLDWGETETIVVTVTVANDLPDGTILTNQATIDSDQTSPVTASETTLVRAPVLQLSKSDCPDPVTLGNTLAYTIVYTNGGVVTATDVVVTESYDGNVSFVAASPSPDVGNNVWLVGDLGGGASESIVVTLTVNGGTTLTNVVTLDSDQTPTQTDVETTTVGTVPALNLAITDVPDPVLNNGILVYNLTYWNNGSGDGTGVVLTETVPTDTAFNAGVSTAGWSCLDGAPAGTICTFSLGTLPPGPGGAVTFAVTVNGGALLVNQAQLGSAEGVSTSDTELTTVVVPGQVTLDKKVSPSTVGTPGERVTYDYAIVVRNAGPSDVNVQKITDTLPAGFNFITTTAAIGLPAPDSTLAGGQDISWFYNSPYPTINAGTSVTLTFVVTSSNGGGAYCNDAAVTVGGDVGVVAGHNLACVSISWPVYQIESQVGDRTIVVRVRIEPSGPVILSWKILP